MYEKYCVVNSGGCFYCVLTRKFDKYLSLIGLPSSKTFLFFCGEDTALYLLYLIVSVVMLFSCEVCLILFDLMNCNPPGSSVHGIFQARILEWVAMPFSKFYLLLHNKPSPSFGLKPTHFICSIFCRSTVGARLSRMILLLVSLRVTNTALGWYSNIVCVRLPVVFIGSHVSKVSLGLCGDKEFPAVSEQIPLCTVYLIC